MIEKEDVVILTAVQRNIFVKGRFTLQDHRSLQRIGIDFEEFFDEEKISKGQVSSEDFFLQIATVVFILTPKSN